MRSQTEERSQTNFSQLHDTLQNAITTTLAGQEGATTDAMRDAFRSPHKHRLRVPGRQPTADR